ncbi:2-succinyl-6-hydroxy-2,4-cyclohexadiene-1-carboxylate synthase [Streptomyces hundungensis]|uniref:2-succinyl-6-hydroxy-2, 4-cyclohexadiene-1-carboxylate synthase n=1 Tax=Streptomyces hundungensis TaxID=1077946 RepID=A0A387HRY3_9ACTN|nr:alpha/beta fold hydrolase [Streptomyces hundungensis]AYG84642.1 2-succinyl-6-hydroxy-2,4-cyclohexadiene-1-carboxylate synthase [Streptomyces hundungensis]
MLRTESVDDLVERFYTVVKLPHDPFAKAFLNRCRSRTLKVDGRFYKYFQSGSGPTVLLVHGLNTNLGSMVPIAEDLLAHGYRVVLFDVPPHGEALGTTGDPTEIRALLRALYDGLPDLHAVVCHSMGGLWALTAWQAGPGPRAVVSLSSPVTKAFLVERFAEVNGLDEDRVRELTGAIEGRFGETVWQEYSALRAVRAIDVPGLVIHGTADDHVPPAHAEQLHANWRQSTLELVDGVGHFDIVEAPGVRKIISAFLRSL